MEFTMHRDGTVSVRMTRNEFHNVESGLLYGAHRWENSIRENDKSGEYDKYPIMRDIDTEISHEMRTGHREMRDYRNDRW